jgi:choline dehydrogenase-like flavoprotein
MEMNCVEKDVSTRLKAHYKGARQMIIGRVANITQPLPGRTNCQYRNKCWLGCPFGAYFSTQSSTLPAAMKTGNLTLRPFSIVTKVLYDKDTKKAIHAELNLDPDEFSHRYLAGRNGQQQQCIGS